MDKKDIDIIFDAIAKNPEIKKGLKTETMDEIIRRQLNISRLLQIKALTALEDIDPNETLNAIRILANSGKLPESNYIIGSLYIIKAGKYYKIGKAQNVKKRFSEIQVSSPKKMEVIFQKRVFDYGTIEKELHKKYKDKRIRGEWFKLTQKDIKEITNELEKI